MRPRRLSKPHNRLLEILETVIFWNVPNGKNWHRCENPLQYKGLDCEHDYQHNAQRLQYYVGGGRDERLAYQSILKGTRTLDQSKIESLILY